MGLLKQSEVIPFDMNGYGPSHNTWFAEINEGDGNLGTELLWHIPLLFNWIRYSFFFFFRHWFFFFKKSWIKTCISKYKLHLVLSLFLNMSREQTDALGTNARTTCSMLADWVWLNFSLVCTLASFSYIHRHKVGRLTFWAFLKTHPFVLWFYCQTLLTSEWVCTQ